MKKTQDQPTKFIDASRRDFMRRSAIVGGAAAGGGVTIAAQAQPTEIEAITQPAKHAGYRLTDQVKEYYRKARF